MGMNETKSIARRAGVVYLALALTGMVGILYVPSTLGLNEAGSDPAVIILNNELLFRIGIFSRLLCQILFAYLVLILYRLFKEVHKPLALQMVVLVVVSIPISFVLELCQVAALLVAKKPDLVGALGADQLNNVIRFFFDTWGQGITIVELFWGLWLIPFGLLAYRSGFIPRILGVILILGGVGYMVTSTSLLILPELGRVIAAYTTIPPAIGGFSIILWLLIIGASKPKSLAGTSEIN
jgi:hypothetical protein